MALVIGLPRMRRGPDVLDPGTVSSFPEKRPLGRPRGGDGELRGGTHEAVELHRAVWAVGLTWSLGDQERGLGVKVARARTAEARKREPEAVHPSLVLVRPVERRAGGGAETVQIGLARAVDGVGPGTRSLAAHLALRFEEEDAALLFDIGDAVYLLVVQHGVIRPGTDVCYENTRDGIAAFRALVREIGSEASRWRFVAGRNVRLDDRHVAGLERADLSDFLVGEPVAPALAPLYFTLPAGVRRVVVASVVLIGFGVVGTWVYNSRFVQDLLREEVVRPVVEVTRDAWTDSLALAPWEAPAGAPSQALLACIGAMRAVPMMSFPEGGFRGLGSTRSVQSMSCANAELDVLWAPALEAGLSEGEEQLRGSMREARAVPVAAARSLGQWRALPVVLDHLEGGIRGDDEEALEALKAEVRKVLASPLGRFDALARAGLGARVYGDSVTVGILTAERTLGWAALGFSLKVPGSVALGRAGTWLAEVDGLGNVVFDRVSWDALGGWTVHGAVVGATERFAAVRASEAEAEMGGRGEG